MVRLVCARRGRVVRWIIRRVRIVGVVIYWSTRRRREVVCFREETRVIRMGGGWCGTVIRAVGAGGVGRILLASSFSFLLGLLTVAPLRCFMCGQTSDTSDCCRLRDRSCSTLASTSTSTTGGRRASSPSATVRTASVTASTSTSTSTSTSGRAIGVHRITTVLSTLSAILIWTAMPP